jgi:hypothetical protein
VTPVGDYHCHEASRGPLYGHQIRSVQRQQWSHFHRHCSLNYPSTNHIAVKYHYFKSHINDGNGIALAKIDTKLQKAEIFTKGSASQKFAEIRKLLCGW